MRERKIMVKATTIAGAKKHTRQSAAMGNRWLGRMEKSTKAAKVTWG